MQEDNLTRVEQPTFRSEVINSTRRPSIIGELVLDRPRFGWVTSTISVILILILTGILSFGTYVRRVHTIGSLVPTTGLLKVSQPKPGTVTKIYSKRGQHVQQGDPLIVLSQESDTNTMNLTRLEIVNQLTVKKQKLNADYNLQQKSFDQQKEALQKRLKFIEEQLKESQKGEAIVLKRYSVAKQTYRRFSSLKSAGIVSGLQLDQQNDLVLDFESQASTSHRQVLELKESRSNVAAELKQLDTTSELKKNDIDKEIADVDQSLMDYELQHATLLRSAVNGYITDIFVHENQVVNSSQVLLVILPDDAKFVAEIWIPIWAVSTIKIGSDVHIRYDTYPSDQFNQTIGTIQSISGSLLSSAEILDQSGVKVEGSSYRAIVSLDLQGIDHEMSRENLRAGLTLRADIASERRAILTWIIGKN